MNYCLTSEEMKKCDAYTISQVGIPSLVLMERAALACVEEIEKRVCDIRQKEALVLAGRGNNGADALAVARLLCEKGCQVSVFLTEPEKRRTADNETQRKILSHYPVKYVSKLYQREYTVIVDGILGIGAKGAMDEKLAGLLRRVSRLTGLKLAVDIPTGVNADDGVFASCFWADVTVTFGYMKRGLALYPGAQAAGEVVVKDIGFSQDWMQGELPGMALLEGHPALMSPVRDASGNKGSFGKCLLITGSSQYPGAAALSALACYRAGAGMVKVLSNEEIRQYLLSNVKESLFGTYEEFSESNGWCSALLIGCGLGRTEDAGNILEQAICRSDKPLVIDADALTLLAQSKRLLQKLARQKTRPIILTPHVMELKRLLDGCEMPVTIQELKRNHLEYTKKLGDLLHCVIVAKDARTLLYEEGRIPCLNTFGNSGLAVAGSGDVLAGIIVSFLGRGMDAFDAAACGVALHARSADKIAAQTGQDFMMPSDLMEEIKDEWKEYV